MSEESPIYWLHNVPIRAASAAKSGPHVDFDEVKIQFDLSRLIGLPLAEFEITRLYGRVVVIRFTPITAVDPVLPFLTHGRTAAHNVAYRRLVQLLTGKMPVTKGEWEGWHKQALRTYDQLHAATADLLDTAELQLFLRVCQQAISRPQEYTT